MTTEAIKVRQTASRQITGQFAIWRIIFMFAWPAIWYTFIIYVIGRALIPAGGTTPSWLRMLIMVFGPGAELAVGLVLLKREGYKLSIHCLRDRLRLFWPKGWKAWGIALLVLMLGLGFSMVMETFNKRLAGMPSFAPPVWWGAASNPTVQVTGAVDVFTDINLLGNYPFLILYFIIGMVFNIFGEEIYYRGYLLPHMRGVFGRGDWIANGVLFTLKHVYQRWLYPGILAGGLCYAFAAGPLGSLPLAMAYHWIGNYLFQMVMLVKAVIGAG